MEYEQYTLEELQKNVRERTKFGRIKQNHERRQYQT